MREFQFRIWSNKYEGFLDDSDFALSLGGSLMTYNSNRNGGYWIDFKYNPENDYVVQQRIGLVDVKGNPIYEGDIVAFDDQDVHDPEDIFEVFWDQTSASFKLCNSWGMGPEISGGYIRVIGNTQENPELFDV